MNPARPLVLALLVVLPAAVYAQGPQPGEPSTNLQIALRGGFALPYGNATGAQGDDLSSTVKNAVPLGIELNYRITPEFYGGFYFEYGFAALSDTLASACASGSCSVRTLGAGLAVFFHFQPRSDIDPWLGVSTGYEQLHVSASGALGSEDATIRGWDILDAQVGVDYRLASAVAVAPTLSLGLGEYFNVDGPNGSGSIDNRSVHGWLKLGVKVSFNP